MLKWFRSIDWASIVGSALFLAFCMLVVVPAIKWSSEGPEQPTYQYTPTNPEEGGPAPKLPEISFWQRTVSEPIAFYTLALAVFSLVLATVSIIQIRFLTLRG